MATQKLTFAKIVSTPSPTSWSQAYTAGNLAAVVSLQRNPEHEEADELSLSIIGKDLLNTFESEYFTLETKNLETITHALSVTCEKITSSITACFAVVCIKDTTAYALLYGNGTILLKRNTQQTILLDSIANKEIQSASGPLEDTDIIILETKQFETHISPTELFKKLQQTDITTVAEMLSPTIHEKQDGTACAILLVYHAEKEQEYTPILSDLETSSEEKPSDDPITLPQQQQPRILFSHDKRMFLTIASVLGIVLIASILFSINKTQENQKKAIFSSFYTPAQKKYDEGQSLIKLNKKLAKEDFTAAYTLLEKAKKTLPKDSEEMKQILALSKKITDSLPLVSGVNMVDAIVVNATMSPLLSEELKNEQISYVTQDDSAIYSLDTIGVTKIDKATQKKTTEIKKDQLPTTPAGLGVYLGNIYVLDQKTGQISKFVSRTKSNYFSDTPSISGGNAIAIDGSIWVLSSNDTIQKFTRGQQETFTPSGLDSPLKNPIRIFTNSDSPNIYILDPENSRIVVFDKNGAYRQQYQSDILKTAKDFDIQEKDKKMYILSQKAIYQISLL